MSIIKENWKLLQQILDDYEITLSVIRIVKLHVNNILIFIHQIMITKFEWR